MTEQELFAGVSPLFSGRFFPDVAPDGAALPFCIYQQVGGKGAGFLEGKALDKKNARIQFTVWSKERLATTALMRELENLLLATPFLASSEGALISRYDEVTKWRGAHQDFSFWMVG